MGLARISTIAAALVIVTSSFIVCTVRVMLGS